MDIQRESKVTRVAKGDLTENLKDLVTHANTAASQAYAPYSNFKVGAAVALADGSVVLGNNQENAAFPSGLCAERVAVLAAKANHPDETLNEIMITVVTDITPKNSFTAPCGGCLQVLWDVQNRQKSPIKIHIQSHNGDVYTAENVNQFLPFGFEL
jgi:cytidine deaminase